MWVASSTKQCWIRLQPPSPAQENSSKEVLTSHCNGIYIPELTGACICVTDGLTFILPPSQPGRRETGSLAGEPEKEKQ